MLIVCLSFATALLLQQQPATPSSAVSHANLTGTWTLNRDQSARPGTAPGPEQGREGQGGRRGGGMGGRGGGMGGRGGGMGGHGGGMGPGGYGGGQGGGDREAMTRNRDLMQEMLDEPARLTIIEHEDKITFAEPDGWTRTYVADGSGQKHQEMSGTIETKTRWDAAKLEIESKTTGGMTVTRTYEISATTPRQLIVTTKIGGGRERGDRPPTRYVYDESPE